MPNSCPDCGAEIEYSEREVRLRTGHCGACGHEFTFVAGAALPLPEPAEPGSGADADAGADTGAPAASGLECEECGTPLTLRARRDGSLEARCEECESTTIYVPRSAAEGEPREGRPSRGYPPGGEGPRSRPCRQCGAPLRFSTNEEGLLVGECDACGNRFTLPPRTDRARGGPRFPRDDRGRGRWRERSQERPSWGGRSRGGGSRSRRFGEDDRGAADPRERRRRKRRDE